MYPKTAYQENALVNFNDAFKENIEISPRRFKLNFTYMFIEIFQNVLVMSRQTFNAQK